MSSINRNTPEKSRRLISMPSGPAIVDAKSKWVLGWIRGLTLLAGNSMAAR